MNTTKALGAIFRAAAKVKRGGGARGSKKRTYKKTYKKRAYKKRSVNKRGIGQYRATRTSTSVFAPRVTSKGAVNCTYFSHSEYIGDIVVGQPAAGSQWALATVPNLKFWRINPRNDEMFPWLSRLAQCFETHQWIYLQFSLRSLCGEYTKDGLNIGSVMAVVDYDVTDPLFNNGQMMMNYDGCVSAKPSNDISIQVDAKKKMVPLTHFYNQDPAQDAISTEDPRFNHIGRLTIAHSGMGTDMVGQTTHQLWVTYRVKLCQPSLHGSAGSYFAGRCASTLNVPSDNNGEMISPVYDQDFTGNIKAVFNKTLLTLTFNPAVTYKIRVFTYSNDGIQLTATNYSPALSVVATGAVSDNRFGSGLVFGKTNVLGPYVQSFQFTGSQITVDWDTGLFANVAASASGEVCYYYVTATEVDD